MDGSETGWELIQDFAERGRFKEYNKKHPQEYAACFANLYMVTEMLSRSAGGVKGFQVSFFRSEGQGVYRIGQKAVKHAKETRLYVYLDEASRRIYILTIGDKDSQFDDIRRCHETAKKLKGEG